MQSRITVIHRWMWVGWYAVGLSALPAYAAQDKAVQFPVSFEQEAPQVRAALEKAYITAQSGEYLGGKRLAYLEFCEAARMGSALGHYWAGRMAMALPQSEGRWVLYHWRTAQDLGSHEAMEALAKDPPALAGQQLRDPPDCLVTPPDLLAVRAQTLSPGLSGLNFSMYEQRLPVDRRRVLDLVRELAGQSSLGSAFVMAIAAVESNFNASALSPKNAMGVMQLIPATAQRFGVRNPYDPHENIRGGIRYLEWLHARFKGDLRLVAAAYNAGEGSVDRYKGVPPFQETQLYVEKVLRYTGLPRPAQK